jgi:hypothetical protein
MRKVGVSVMAGTSCLVALPAARADWIQWPSSQGGNDHFYNAVSVPGGLTWQEARVGAESLGGYLVTLTSEAENTFVFGLVDSPEFWFPSGGHNHGPWLGGLQPPGSPEPGGGWEWISGEPWDYTNWHPAQPDNDGDQDRLIFYSSDMFRAATWDDLGGSQVPIRGYVVESAVPVPGTLALMSVGLVALKRRRRVAS